MNQNNNKHQWFDGWIYSSFIAPNLHFLFNTLHNSLNPSTSVLDVACGTGYFGLTFHSSFKNVVGVDLSETNINKANSLKNKHNIKNINFIHNNATELSQLFQPKTFDYAFISLALHEMPENLRLKVINQVAIVSKEQVFIDYAIDKFNFWTIAVILSEFFAGIEHFANYRNYKKNLGLYPLLDASNLTIISDTPILKYNLRMIRTKSKEIL